VKHVKAGWTVKGSSNWLLCTKKSNGCLKGFRRSAAEQALVKIVEEETAAEGLGQQIRWNLNLNEHMRQNPLPKAEVVEMKSSGWVTKEAMDKLSPAPRSPST